VIVRVYWDGDTSPSVEAPVGDFFCNSWNTRQAIVAQPINVNPSGGMNCYFPMPFRQHARITVENDSPVDLPHFFYTINYTLEEVDPDALYFHAQWRRSNPLQYGTDYVMVDGIKGQGQYVGTFMAWQQNNAGWWGETDVPRDGSSPPRQHRDYLAGPGAWRPSAPYLGYKQVIKKSGEVGARMTLYRFHVCDPVFFREELRVTMQAIGWRSEGRYLPLQDDIAAVVYWYQTLPHAPFPALPGRNDREII
jgi:hypothetical protein